MAMTKEELVDLIDSTINSNGEKSITGQALNLALKEIVDAMGSGDGGATMVLNCDNILGDDLTDEQKAENVLLYNALLAAENTPTSISIYSKIVMEGMGVFWGQCPFWMVGTETGEETMAFVAIGVPTGTYMVQLAADGSVAVVDDLSLSNFKL